MFEALPKRPSFPRVQPAQPTRPSGATSLPSDAPPPVRSPSSRLRTTPERTPPSARPDRTSPSDRIEREQPAAAPTSRPIDRERILERYRRPAADPTGKPAQPDAPKSADDVKAKRDAFAQRGADKVKADRDANRAETARDVSARRDKFSERQAAAVEIARDQYRSAQAEKAATKRSQWNAQQQVKLDARKATFAAAATAALGNKYGGWPQGYDDLAHTGSTFAKCHGWSVGLGIGLGFGWCSPYAGYWNSYWNDCWPGSWWWWNGWNNTSYWGWGWSIGAYPYSSWCHPLAFGYRWWWGSWPGSYYQWWPSAYASYWSAAPIYYSTVIVDPSYQSPDSVQVYVDGQSDVTVYEDGQEVYGDGATEAEQGEAVQYGAAPRTAPEGGAAALLDRGPDTLSRAANQHLAQGDQAFRERRYADAVHYYAKAIEYRPNEGVMYLVLADALLATGDYHYGAFALRRALELDPTLASSEIDKHEFYSFPAEFDEQLQLLERFLADHPADADARLLLAANYLFGRKPALAVDLLESGASANVRNEAAGKLVLEAAKRARAATTR
jgi:hypothetical protein